MHQTFWTGKKWLLSIETLVCAAGLVGFWAVNLKKQSGLQRVDTTRPSEPTSLLRTEPTFDRPRLSGGWNPLITPEKKESLVGPRLVYPPPQGEELEGLFNEIILQILKTQEGASKNMRHDWLLNAYLNGLLTTLLSGVERPQKMYEDPAFALRSFWLLKRDFNAYAAAYSLFFINSQLLLDLPTEGNLAAVIGHELGHLLLGHSLGPLQGRRGYLMQGAQNSRADEAAADKIGLQLLMQAGWPPELFISTMLALQKSESNEHLSKKKGSLSIERSKINKYQDVYERQSNSSHPVTHERITDLEYAIDEFAARTYPRKNSSDFWLSKARMMTLFETGSHVSPLGCGGVFASQTAQEQLKQTLKAWQIDEDIYKNWAGAYGLALFYTERKEWANALHELEGLSEEALAHPWIALLRRKVFAQTGKSIKKEHIDALYDAFQKKYGKEVATGVCSEFLSEQGEFSAAAQMLEELLKQMHSHAFESALESQLSAIYLKWPSHQWEGHFLLGRIYQRQCDISAALQEYRVALDLAKRDKNLEQIEKINAAINQAREMSKKIDLVRNLLPCPSESLSTQSRAL